METIGEPQREPINIDAIEYYSEYYSTSTSSSKNYWKNELTLRPRKNELTLRRWKNELTLRPCVRSQHSPGWQPSRRELRKSLIGTI
jgi:hypothetical protein